MSYFEEKIKAHLIGIQIRTNQISYWNKFVPKNKVSPDDLTRQGS